MNCANDIILITFGIQYALRTQIVAKYISPIQGYRILYISFIYRVETRCYGMTPRWGYVYLNIVLPHHNNSLNEAT